jgi:hypothetical protein
MKQPEENSKIMKPICLSLLVLTGTLLGARGERFRTDINPALLYYQAFLVAPEAISEADRNYLTSKKGREQKLPERFGAIVAGYDNQFRLVRQAACATVPCDWGLDVSAGPNTPDRETRISRRWPLLPLRVSNLLKRRSEGDRRPPTTRPSGLFSTGYQGRVIQGKKLSAAAARKASRRSSPAISANSRRR